MARAGLCTIADKTKTAAQMIDLAADAGADAVEIWSQPDHVSYPSDPSQLDRIREHAADRGIAIAALGSYLGNRPEIGEEFLTIENEIAIARALGTDVIRVWPGDRNFEEYDEDELSFLCSEIYAWGDTASESGIRIVMERHNNTVLNRWDGIGQILEEIDCDNVYLNYQVPDPAPDEMWKERGAEDYWRWLPYSLHAHLQNYAPRADDSADPRVRTYLDCGLVDYSELGEAARNVKYEGYFMVEFLPDLREGLDDLQALKRDIDFIKSL